jgi:hypothetical protein
MARIELCKFTHGLGLYILRFSPSLPLGVKFEYKGPAHVYICTALCLERKRGGKSKNIKAQPMCKFAQLYACHELFRF